MEIFGALIALATAFLLVVLVIREPHYTLREWLVFAVAALSLLWGLWRVILPGGKP
jgi:hypothetical protein